MIDKYLKIATGFFLGGFYGLASIFILVGMQTIIYTGYSLLASAIQEETPLSNVLLSITFNTVVVALLSTFALGLVAVNIGVVVGMMNGATNGGIGAGIEWIFIIGGASVLGAWWGQINIDSYLSLGILSGLIGGSVGWLTWFTFRSKGKKNPVTFTLLTGYSLVSIYVCVTNPLLTAFTVLVMDD